MHYSTQFGFRTQTTRDNQNEGRAYVRVLINEQWELAVPGALDDEEKHLKQYLIERGLIDESGKPL
jgi:hypothetical protein